MDGLALSEFKLDERPLVSRRGNPWEVRDQKSGENRWRFPERERERSTMWVIWAHVEPSHPLQNDSGWKWRNSVIWKESLTILTWHLVLVHKTAVEERLLISSILRTMETTMGRNIYKYGKWKDLNKHYDVLLKLEKPACIYSFSYK